MVSAVKEKQPPKYFCPIWYSKMEAGMDWWMTFNHDTYSHDLLRLMGYKNIFGERERRYPLEADLGLEAPQSDAEGDKRYPRVTLSEIVEAGPELILLPDEPFVFTEQHQSLFYQLLEDTPAAQNESIILLDGTLITWCGTRLAHALRELPALLDLG
jgi:ABC-type Fe3+-hydroxamate transport system substrate-binding protein